MANLEFAVEARTVLGKKVAGLRRAGVTPANIYGHNVPSLAVQGNTHDLDLLLRRAGRTALITLALAGEREPRSVLVRDVQRKPTTGGLLHVDFVQVSMRERLKVSVPVVLMGHAPVLDTANCIIVQVLDQIEVECLPGDIPQHLEVDVSGMADTTSVLHARDIPLPRGVDMVTDPDAVMASVNLTVAEEEEEAAEAAEAEEVPVAGGEEESSEES
ncbi:MAG: 50S ribosomal protein L25 [Chloroflexi bacterium]|nr:50S ribosomal protein L25 [Chloroflexota bacterium]